MTLQTQTHTCFALGCCHVCRTSTTLQESSLVFIFPYALLDLMNKNLEFFIELWLTFYHSGYLFSLMDNRICFKRRPRPLFLCILTAHVIRITTFRHVIHAVHELKKKKITSNAPGFVNFARKFQFSIFCF